MTDKTPAQDLPTFIANLTSLPGVYRMLDSKGQVLYVGKALNLKKRVGSYFNQSNHGAKTRSLVSQIAAIDVSITQSETEALLLESSLIKSLRPKYNVLMRDDKSYPFIHVSNAHPFPRIEMVRFKKKPSTGEYFGPYPNVVAVRETLGLIQKIFKIRNCSDTFFSGRARPCLQYQIKRCTAPCTGYISQENYKQSVHDARRFLQGKSLQIIEELSLRMTDAVRELCFEEAAKLRDQIKHLRQVQEQQGIVRLEGDADVIAILVRQGVAGVQCVTVRDGNVISSQRFFPALPKQPLLVEDDVDNALWQQVLEAFLGFYYLDTPERIPRLIVLNQSVKDKEILQDMLGKLAGVSMKINTNPRGKMMRWLHFAINNLELGLDEKLNSKALMATRYEALDELLKLKIPISRMECFDISHTQGTDTVASCVVFDENGPLKREYRRFNITGITPGDDYQAMEQAILRRFKRLKEEKRLPSVLLIDGGKGQVRAAYRVFETLDIEGVRIIGIAKGADRKVGFERLILDDLLQEITLPEHSPAFHLLQHLRDEAHRFAITAHRKKRGKTSLSSSFDDLEGIGPARRKALLLRFGGVAELSRASIDEIQKVKGISRELASRIFKYFHA